MPVRSLRYLLLTVIVALASSAQAQVVCITPDGKVNAVNDPPPNCRVQTKFRAKPAMSSEDAQALNKRREIESRARAAARQLAAARAELVRLPAVDSAKYGPASWSAYDKALDAREARERSLSARESQLVWTIDDAKRDFEILRSTVAAMHEGKLPLWWGPMRCAACP